VPDPSNGELAHRIEGVKADLKEDVREVSKRLDSKVSLERYELERRSRDEVHTAMIQRIAAIETAREKEKQEAVQARQRAEDQRRADRRLIFSALIVPVLIVLLQAYLATKGAS
jgi:CHASE3 domain sensor protein